MKRAFQREDEGGRENAEQVGAFLERLYKMEQLKDRLLLMRAAREAGDSRLEELIRQKEQYIGSTRIPDLPVYRPQNH